MATNISAGSLADKELKNRIDPADKYLPGVLIFVMFLAVLALTWLLTSTIKDICVSQPDKCPTQEVQDERAAAIAKAKVEAEKKVSDARAAADAAGAASAASK